MENPDRRVVHLRLTDQELIDAIRDKYEVPGDAKLVGITWDGTEAALTLRSQDYDEVAVGESVATIPLTSRVKTPATGFADVVDASKVVKPK